MIAPYCILTVAQGFLAGASGRIGALENNSGASPWECIYKGGMVSGGGDESPGGRLSHARITDRLRYAMRSVRGNLIHRLLLPRLMPVVIIFCSKKVCLRSPR